MVATRKNECYVKTVEPRNAAHLNILHGTNDRKETVLQHCDDGRETEATKRARLPLDWPFTTTSMLLLDRKDLMMEYILPDMP